MSSEAKAAANANDTVSGRACSAKINSISPNVIIHKNKAVLTGADGVHVIKGSGSVIINGLQAVRHGDSVTWVCPGSPPPSGKGNIEVSQNTKVFFGD